MPKIVVPDWNGTVAAIGDPAILRRRKTAFLCSRQFPARIVLPAYDWAKTMRDNGECVISGFHSPIERDVLDILLRGAQPLILVLARALQRRTPPQIKQALTQNRLLILSPFPQTVTRPTAAAARRRNAFMLHHIADAVIVAYTRKDGLLQSLLAQTDKQVTYLNSNRQNSNRR